MENLRKRNTHKPNWLGVTRFLRNCETDKAEKRRIKIAHFQRRSVQDEARGPSALPLVEEICVTRPSGQVFSEAQVICIAYMTWWWFIYIILLHVEDRYRLCAQYGSVFNLAVLQAQSTITPTAQSSGLRPAEYVWTTNQQATDSRFTVKKFMDMMKLYHTQLDRQNPAVPQLCMMLSKKVSFAKPCVKANLVINNVIYTLSRWSAYKGPDSKCQLLPHHHS